MSASGQKVIIQHSNESEGNRKKNRNPGRLLTSISTASHCKYSTGKGNMQLAPMFCSTKILQMELGETLRDCAILGLRHFLLILRLCK